MAIYDNQNENSAIRSIEFSTIDDVNFTFFHLKDKANKDETKRLILSTKTSQEIISETELNGHPILVTQSKNTPHDIIDSLKSLNEHFSLHEVKKPFDAWWWRGASSTLGQSLLLASSLQSSKPTSDQVSIGVSAATNLAANAINMQFGSQEKDDPHQLQFLKERVYRKLKPFVSDGEICATPNESNSLAAEDAKPTPSFTEKLYAFIKRHSVKGGDVAMRLFGSLSLAYPISNLGIGWSKVSKGESLSSGLSAARNENPLTYSAGLMSLLGKAFGFAAKEPDPYNPKKPSWIDTVQEKYAFHLTSAAEASAAVVMAYDRLKNQKITFGGKTYPDFLGFIGNIIILGGYGFRTAASYGSRQVNMQELSTYVADIIAKTPREQMASLAVASAIDIKEHFKDEGPELSQIYNQIGEAMLKNHNLALSHPSQKAIPQNLVYSDEADSQVSFVKKELDKYNEPKTFLQK